VLEALAFFILPLLIWLPLLFLAISRRGFVVILAWLFIAPVTLNVINKIGGAPLVEMQGREGGSQERGGYLGSKTNVRLRELVEPTRILFVGFAFLFLLETMLKRRRLRPFDTVEKFAFLFSLILIASALFKSNRIPFALRVSTDAFIIPFLAYFVARRLVTTEEQLRNLMRVLAYMGIYVIIIGLIERITLPGLTNRVTGPFEGREEIYIVLAVVFFLAWMDVPWRGYSSKEGIVLPRIARQFVLFFAPLIILLGWSRGNLVGLLSGVWMFMFFGRRLVSSSRIMGTVGLLLVLVPTLAIGLYEVIPEEIFEARISRPSTVYARLGAWQLIAEQISKSPVTGVGFNNLRDILDDRRIIFEGIKSETHAHNSFLSILAELGLIGLLAYLAIGGSIVRTGLLLYQRGGELHQRWRGVALIAIITAYWVSALFATSLHLPTVSHVYVYITAGAIAGVHVRRRSVVAAGSIRSRLTKIPVGAIGESKA
jgi:O-antigen ligase